jgi:hypothetical protein
MRVRDANPAVMQTPMTPNAGFRVRAVRTATVTLPALLSLIAFGWSGCSRRESQPTVAPDDAIAAERTSGIDYDKIRVALVALDVDKCASDRQGDSELEVVVATNGQASISRVISTSLGQDPDCLKEAVHFRVEPPPSQPLTLQLVLSAREPGFGLVRYKTRMELWLRSDAEQRGDSGLKPPVLHVEKL